MMYDNCSQSEDLRNVLFGATWYEMPLPCQKEYNLLQIMLCRQLCFTTLFNTQANMENMTKVSRTISCLMHAILNNTSETKQIGMNCRSIVINH